MECARCDERLIGRGVLDRNDRDRVHPHCYPVLEGYDGSPLGRQTISDQRLPEQEEQETTEEVAEEGFGALVGEDEPYLG